MLKPVLLLVIQDLVVRIQGSQLGDCSYPRRVIGGDRGTLEALAHNVGSNADALGVVGRVEDAAGRLRWLEKQPCLVVINSYLHEIQYSRPWDRHLCAVVVALGGVAELDSSRIWLGTLKMRTTDVISLMHCESSRASYAWNLPACRKSEVARSTTTIIATGSTSAAVQASPHTTLRLMVIAVAMLDTGIRSSVVMATNNPVAATILLSKPSCLGQTCTPDS